MNYVLGQSGSAHKKSWGFPELNVNMKLCEFVNIVMCLKYKSLPKTVWLNDSLSDNSNTNLCVCKELIRYAILKCLLKWNDFC